MTQRLLVQCWKGPGQQHHPLAAQPVPCVQDPGLQEGATHRGEADQCHQGDPGGHQERGPAERLLRVTRWARARDQSQLSSGSPHT